MRGKNRAAVKYVSQADLIRKAFLDILFRLVLVDALGIPQLTNTGYLFSQYPGGA